MEDEHGLTDAGCEGNRILMAGDDMMTDMCTLVLVSRGRSETRLLGGKRRGYEPCEVCNLEYASSLHALTI